MELQVFAPLPPPADFLNDLGKELRFRLDLDSDLEGFWHLSSTDRLLGPAVERLLGMRVSCMYSLYEALVVMTLLQNTTVQRTVQMMETLFREYGSDVSFDGQRLHSFWTPERLAEAPESDLRSLRLGYRARTLKRQAELFASDPALSETKLRRLDSDRLRERLLDIYGVGPATVSYLLFDVFKRYDALDHVSPWEAKIYTHLIFGGRRLSPRTMARLIRQRWGAWRMLAVHYLFEDLFWRHRQVPVPWLTPLLPR